MNFDVGIYPIYGFMLGINWSKIDYLDDEITEQNIQISLGILLIEIKWNS